MKPPAYLRRHLAPWLLSAPALALLLLFAVGPLLLLVRMSCYEPGVGVGSYRPGTWSLQGYRELADERYFRQLLVFTVLLAAAVALLALAVSYPLAVFIRSLSPRGRALAVAAVLLPKLASVLAVIYGLQLVLSNSGPVNQLLVVLGVVRQSLLLYHNLPGVLIGETYLIVPYAVLVLVAALERIDPQLVAAARGLGASPWQAFRRVTLPLSLPGLFLAGQLSFVWALGALLVPLLLGGPEETTLGLEVQRQAFVNNNWPLAARVAVLLLVTLAVGAVLTGAPLCWLRRQREGAR